MSSARKHLRNLAFNWGGHASTLLVMFFLSPYIVGKLDAVSYGIWSLLSVLTGYMGVFDLGVRASVGRHVALYLGKGDPVGVDETIRAGFGVFTLTGGLILVVGILLGWSFPALFKGVSPEHYDTVRYLLPLMVVNVWFSAIAAIYSSVLAAHDRFDVARIVDMVVLAIRTVATVYVLHVGWGLWGLAGTVIGGNVIAVVGNRIYAGIYHQGLRSFPFLFSRQRIQELVGYGTYAFITSAAVKIIGQSDLVIVGAFLSVSAVREYSVGAMLVFYSSTFINIICQTFFPALQKTVSGGTLGEVRYLVKNQLLISLSVGLFLYIGIFYYSEAFIRLWMLQENFDIKSVIAASNVMMILSLTKIPGLLIQPCQSALSALGYMRFNAFFALIEALINIIVSLVLVLYMGLGLQGVAAGTLIARVVVPMFIIPLFFCFKTSYSLRRLFFDIVVPGSLSALLFSFACNYILKFFYPQNWVVFFTNVTISGFVWCLIFTGLLTTKDIRRQFRIFFKNKKT